MFWINLWRGENIAVIPMENPAHEAFMSAPKRIDAPWRASSARNDITGVSFSASWTYIATGHNDGIVRVSQSDTTAYRSSVY